MKNVIYDLNILTCSLFWGFKTSRSVSGDPTAEPPDPVAGGAAALAPGTVAAGLRRVQCGGGRLWTRCKGRWDGFSYGKTEFSSILLMGHDCQDVNESNMFNDLSSRVLAGWDVMVQRITNADLCIKHTRQTPHIKHTRGIITWRRMPQTSHPPIIIFHHFPGVQWPLALQFLAQQQGACNVVICTACVTACARGSAWEAACGVLWEMRRGRVEPNEFTASAVISAYQKGQKWQEALEILECRCGKYGGYIGSFLLGNDDEHAFCILLFGCLSLIVIGLLLFGWFFQLVHFSGPRTGFSRTSSPIW